MSRRLEIELTSRADDGGWTWRAAGARQPRGTIGPDFVPSGTSVGDVLRAEIDIGLEGIEIIAILPSKPTRSDGVNPNRIEVIGVPHSGPDVSVLLAPGSRRRRDGDDRPDRRGDGPRGERGAQRAGERRGSERGERRPAERGERRGPERGERRDGASRDEHRPRDDGTEGDRRTERRGPAPQRRERKVVVSTAHRNEALAALKPEELPIAEQLLRGGIPAVRQAIEEQNATVTAEGKPPVAADALLKMAEGLLPVIRLAEWKDRAVSAQNAGKELRLRELRAVVAASRTVTLDEDGKATAKALQESLTHRVGSLRDEWVQRIVNALDQGRVLDALRVSVRAPEPGTRCPAELAVRLAADAGTAMTAELDAPEWVALLDAVLESPVRRTVKPLGIPADEGAQSAARRAAGSVPELAKLLGLRIPPPPPRRLPPRRVLTPSSGEGSAVAP